MFRDVTADQGEAHAWSESAVSFAHPHAVGPEGDGIFEGAGVDRGSSADEVCDVDRDVDEGVRADAGEFSW